MKELLCHPEFWAILFIGVFFEVLIMYMCYSTCKKPVKEYFKFHLLLLKGLFLVGVCCLLIGILSVYLSKIF